MAQHHPSFPLKSNYHQPKELDVGLSQDDVSEDDVSLAGKYCDRDTLAGLLVPTQSLLPIEWQAASHYCASYSAQATDDSV